MSQISLIEERADYSSSRFPPPRGFQGDAQAALRSGRLAGHKNQLVMSPTGSGKTYLGLSSIQKALAKGFTACFVCDRTTLINQTSATADKYGLTAHGIIQADHWRTDRSWPFQIASAQSLDGRGWPKADLIVIDEAHTQHSSWVRHIMKTEASVIGLSATPFSKGLGKLFTNLVNAATMHDLTEQGILVPMTVMRCEPIDMTGAETANGEWTDAAAEQRGMQIVGDVVTEWVAHGGDRKTICFGATVKHCEELCNQFVKAGVMAALFTGHTTPEDRKSLLDEFTKPDSTLRILISVEALAKGFDVPDVACVIDCRPMRKSLSTVIQMWGRMLRCFPGKVDGLLLDHSGNSARFVEDFTDIFFNGLDSLDSGEKLDSDVRKEPPIDTPQKGCPKCGFKPFAKRCMKCGFEIEVVATVEHKAGVMQEVTLTKGKTVDRQSLYQQCVAYARANSAPEKQEYRAKFLFRDMTGSMPPDGWRPDSVSHAVEVSKEVRSKILSLNIKRAKSRTRPGAEA